MDFFEAVRNGFRNYASASGRASRSEFWYWMIFSSLCGAAGNIVDLAIFHNIDSGLVAPLISLALLLPDVAVSIRRLHDLDRSGWWLLICFTGIGIIVLLVWDCMRGTLGPNRFGLDPIAPPAVPAAVQT
jgi:uncharacterized membrane protein YhaH (DUF805 family)